MSWSSSTTRAGRCPIARSVMIRGPSVMAGYFANRQATDEVMSTDGFLRTGDMGYWLDGEIVITGRAKDLILLNGRNLAAGHRMGGRAARGPAQRRCCGLCRRDRRRRGQGGRSRRMPHQRSAGARAAAHQGRPPGPRGCRHRLRRAPCGAHACHSSSGKLSRSGARQRYLQGLADIALSSPGSVAVAPEMAVTQ